MNKYGIPSVSITVDLLYVQSIMLFTQGRLIIHLELQGSTPVCFGVVIGGWGSCCSIFSLLCMCSVCILLVVHVVAVVVSVLLRLTASDYRSLTSHEQFSSYIHDERKIITANNSIMQVNVGLGWPTDKCFDCRKEKGEVCIWFESLPSTTTASRLLLISCSCACWWEILRNIYSNIPCSY